MIFNSKHYQKKSLNEKKQALRHLSKKQILKQVEELLSAGWTFVAKQTRPLPIALVHLIKKG